MLKRSLKRKSGNRYKGFFNSLSRLISLANRENIEKQRLMDRIKRIIEESIEIINKSNNPKTVFSRYDVIKVKVAELFSIAPDKIQNINLNGRDITADNLVEVVDSAKSEWLFDYAKKESGQIFKESDTKNQKKMAKQLIKRLAGTHDTSMPFEFGEIKQKLESLLGYRGR